MKTQTAFERGEFVLAKIATQWNKNNKSVSAALQRPEKSAGRSLATWSGTNAQTAPFEVALMSG